MFGLFLLYLLPKSDLTKLMKKLLYFIAPIILASACGSHGVTEKLIEIDSLIVKEQIDSACVVLNELDKVSMTAEDQAHYYLLKTRLGYLTNNPLPSDSLLDLAIIYYKNEKNQHKLADAYYYKSCRSRVDKDYPQAIIYGKEAERFAKNTNDDRLQFKIAENLAYLNGLCENDQLQLQYAKKALELAQKVQNKNWIAYSYNSVSFALANLGQYDSAHVYIEKSVPYLDYVYDYDKAAFLTNIGQLYKEKDTKKAKEYFEKALQYNEFPETFEHLADIYFAEGNKEEAYKLWKKAITKESRYDKSNIIVSILSYDLERGNLDEASKNLDEIIAIKDSVITALKNDTIADLQIRFDQETAIRKHEEMANSWQKWLLFAILLVTLLVAYIIIKRYRDKNRIQEAQMQIIDLMNQIRAFEAAGEKDSEAVRLLNEQVSEAMNQDAASLQQGKQLYDHVMNGGTVSSWRKKDFELFIDYYTAIDFKTVSNLKKTKRKERLTIHNLFFLLLKEMGFEKKEIARILGIGETSVNTLNTRTKPIE